MDFSSIDPKLAIEKIGSHAGGLTSDEVARRLEKYGQNLITKSDKFEFIRKLLSPFKSAFVLILILGGVISYITGHIPDTVIIFIVVLVNAVIEWGQQYSASKVLDKLKAYSTKHVQVRRSKKIITINSTELVPGDIVLISEGEKVPADGRLLSNRYLVIDESNLTGESMAVKKQTDMISGHPAIYEQKNMVFSSTLVQSGEGEFLVTATGNHTQLGKIAKLTETKKQPPIAKKINRLTLNLIIATSIGIGITVILGLLQGNSLEEMVRFAVALIVSVIPEGLPVTLTIIFLLGIQRMAKKNAFVRNLPAVETLGMITAIATDKTGTITKNELSISEIWSLDGDISEKDHTDIWLSVSHSNRDTHHSIEKIITNHTEKYREKPTEWKEFQSLPFKTSRRYTAVLWQKNKTYGVYIKGAPETVIEKCKLTSQEHKRIASTA